MNNATLNIQVRVAARAAAREMDNFTGSVTRANAAATKGGGIGAMMNSASFHRGMKNMEKFGKNLQWVGRQLTWNFTIPIGIAGYAATKWALENEKAMTKVRKVYGDLSLSSKTIKEETDALAKTFELLSSRFGEHQSKVIEVGAAWAAAGSAGVGLAKNVRSTLEASIIGEMELNEATEALIATMAAYGLTADELGDSLATLNIIENETAAQFGDLIQVIQRAAGAARTGGVDLRHLAAMAAQLVPATGNAARAGSALRTVISRIMSPTAKAAEELNRMGLEVETLGWTSLNFTERMQRMSEGWEELTNSEKAYITSTIASRWQVNRFDVLMRGFIDTQSFYKKALEASSDSTRNATVYQRELLAVLESNPRKLQIMANVVKNELTKAFEPLLPAVVGIVKGIASLARAFGNLSPDMQKMILSALLFLAVIGPMAQYLGAIVLLFSQLGLGAMFAGRGIFWVAKNMLPLFTIALVKVIDMVWAFVTTQVLGAGTVSGAWATSAATTTSSQAAAATATTGIWARATAAIKLMALSTGRFFGGMAAGMKVMALATGRFFIGMASAIITTTVNWSAIFMAIHARTAAGTAGIWGAFSSFWVALWRFARLVVVTWGSWMLTYMRRLVILLVKPLMVAMSGVATAITGAVTSPVWAVVAVIAAAVAAIVLLMNDDLRNGFLNGLRSIVQYLGQLPGVVVQVMTNVVRVIANAMRAVIDWLSYLNPFARHSPSLVDNVRAGVATILDEYDRLRMIPGLIRQAASAHDAFNRSTSGARRRSEDVEYADQRSRVVAHAPGAGGAFDAVVASIRQLESTLPRVKRQIMDQTVVVNFWAAAIKVAEQRVSDLGDQLDLANEALQRQEDVLQSYENALSSVLDEIQAVESAIGRLASMPIEGMREYEDQLFANETAQKQLRLEILKLEKAQQDEGDAVDDLSRRYAALGGMIELMRGSREDLRLAGAGSDVLGGLDSQISSLEAQRRALGDSMASTGAGAVGETEVDRLRKQLEDLQREGEILDLEKWLEFAPLQRQIDDLVNGIQEMTFEEIIRQIKEQQTLLADLRDREQEIIDKIKEQEGVVEEARKARDAIEAQLKIEQAELERINDLHDIQRDKLGALEDAYSAITSQIGDMRSALSDFISLAESAQGILEGAGSAVDDAAGAGAAAGGSGDGRPDFGEFEVPGGDAILSPEGGLSEIEDFNKLLEEELGAVLGEMDIFAPIKDAWNATWEWIKDAWNDTKEWLIRNLSIEGLDNFGSDIGDGIKAGFEAIGNAVVWVWQNLLYPTFMAIWDFISPVLIPVFEALQAAVEAVWNAIGTAISWVWNSIILPVWDAIKWFVETVLVPIFNFLQSVVEAVWNAIGTAISWVWNTIIKPVWDAIWGFITGYLIPIFTLFQTIAEIVFTAIGAVIVWVWNTIIKPVWDAIYGWLKDTLPNAFTWLKDKGSEAFDLLGKALAWVNNNIIQPVWDAIKWVIENIVGPAFAWLLDKGKTAFEALGTALGWVNDNIISPVWNGIKWAIENIVEPAFTWLSDRVSQIWNGISSIIATAWNGIAGIIEGGINGFVGGFNIIAGAVNKVAEFVGADSRVTEMSRVSLPRMGGGGGGANWAGLEESGLAKGGSIPTPWGNAAMTGVGSGFVTDGVRAIVGEGSRHPEYVIPTDPRYRGRAQGLFEDLGGRLFAKGGVIPALGLGDIIGGVVGGALGPMDPRRLLSGVDELKNLATAAYGMIDNARSVLGGLAAEPVRAAGKWAADEGYDWIKDQAAKGVKKLLDLAATFNPVNMVGGIVGAITGGGGGGNNLARVRSALISGTYVTSTYRTPERNRAVGGSPTSYHMDRNNPAVDIGGSTAALDRLAPKLRGMGGWREFLWRTKGHYDHIHVAKMGTDMLQREGYERGVPQYPIDLATGGRIRRRSGGTLLRVGEGRHDEEVQVLPVHGKDGDGGKNYNFYGDLSFPNITSPDDAETFIRNLESLV